MNKIFKYIIFFSLIGLFFNSDYFERKFFLNEIFALFGILCLLFTRRNKKTKINIRSFDFWVYMFLLICIFHLVISIPKKTNWYFYARNSVIFYSVFAYFFGKYFFVFFDRTTKRLNILLKGFVAFALLIQKMVLARYSGPILFPLLFKKTNLKTVLFLIILIVAHGILHDALSVIILALFLFVFWILPNYKYFQIFIFFCFLGLFVFYLIFYDNIILYRVGEYRYFGNVINVYESHPLLRVDHNTSWRFILWFRFMIERFPENLFGIGFGTPLLHYLPNIQTASMVIDEVHAHVSGAHNTFVTLFVRLGLVGLFVLTKISLMIFKGFYRLKKINKNSPYLRYYFIWFIIFSLGLFNLCLESPLRASLFWISLGFISKIQTLKLE